MADKTIPTTALLDALALAEEYGGASEALRATAGLDLDHSERFVGLPEDLDRLVADRPAADALRQALALGFLAGRVAHRPRPRRAQDATSFLMDPDLLVQNARGESILRLPWFEEGLFVGRQLPDICEMPEPVRMMCIDNYRAALLGDRRRFAFTSYGHAYRVEAVPVRSADEGIDAVLAIAHPAAPATGRLRAAVRYDRIADALEVSARLAEQQADLYRAVGNGSAEAEAREAADKAQQAARRARATAFRHRSRDDR